ncbi:MAG: hypothetical protein AAFN09_12000 [Pseudomonadota bacterium]
MARVPGKKWSGEPDLSDAQAFIPPPWVRRLFLIQDGDSNPTMTQAKLQACALRAQAARPGLACYVIEAAPGCDLNDML